MHNLRNYSFMPERQARAIYDNFAEQKEYLFESFTTLREEARQRYSDSSYDSNAKERQVLSQIERIYRSHMRR